MTWLETWEAKARAATQGQWVVLWDDDDEYARVHGIYTESGKRLVETDAGFYPPQPADATHIAHSNPEFVLAVIEKLRRAEEALSSLHYSMGKTIDLTVDWTPQPGVYASAMSTVVRNEDIERLKHALAELRKPPGTVDVKVGTTVCGHGVPTDLKCDMCGGKS